MDGILLNPIILKKMINRIDANEKSYEIKEIYKRNIDDNEQIFLILKEKNKRDALIKNNTHYFLCNEITDAEFNELPNDDITNIITDTLKDIEN